MILELIKYTIPSIISLLTAYYVVNKTTQLALKRFYSEKWWERKATAYTDIMEALYILQRDVGEEWDSFFPQEQVSVSEEESSKLEEESAKLKADVDKARQQIEKIIDIGAFVVSEEAVELIKTLLRKLHEARKEELYFEYVDAQYSALNEAIKQFRDYAKRDLNVE